MSEFILGILSVPTNSMCCISYHAYMFVWHALMPENRENKSETKRNIAEPSPYTNLLIYD